MNKIKLNDGNYMPIIGLGTFPMLGKDCIKAVKSAYSIGYSLFDTSPAYGNEVEIGKGLFSKYFSFINKQKRKKIFLTSKLFLDACRKNEEQQQLMQTLKNLRTDYLDLWLLHWADPNCFIKNYKEMEKAKKSGLVKSIGVCNCEIHHLEKIIEECEIIPAVNQVELHPLLNQKELIAFCSKYDIKVEAYSPFARMEEKLIKNPNLISIAQKYNKKVTQIIIKWNIQQGRIVIPKTSDKFRQKENLTIFDFELSQEDLNIIDSINENLRFRFHPDEYPLSH